MPIGRKGNTMKITVFSKQRTLSDGRIFYTYIGRLIRKSTGEEITVAVRFRNDCGKPDPHTCPRVIEFDKKDANFTEKSFLSEDGEKTINSRTLWLTAWEDAGAFVDTSMDDFE